jgi:hypothetical protein
MITPARYLLDTSAVISRPDPKEVPADAELMICTITLAELNAGIHSATDPVELSDRVARLRLASEGFAAIPFTTTDAHMYSKIVALVLASGRNPRSRQTDLLIASVAAVRRMPLITRNARDVAGLESMLEVVALS